MIKFIPEDYPGCVYRYRVRMPETRKKGIENYKWLKNSNIKFISGSDGKEGIYTFTNEKDAFWFCMMGQ